MESGSSTVFESISSTHETFSQKRKLKNITDSGNFSFGSSGSLRIKPNETEVSPVKVSLDDLDDLISALSADELSELSKVDPDDSSMPPSMRCVYKCEKEGSDSLNRKAMLNQLQEVALTTPDKEERVKFVPGTIRGKKYVPKARTPVPDRIEGEEYGDEEVDYSLLPEDHTFTLDDEYVNAIEQASLQEVVELADILGITYQDHCRATDLNVYPPRAPNETDIERILGQVSGNDAELIEINFNNIKGISKGYWTRFFEALTSNGFVESLSATNCGITDPIANLIASMLRGNSSLRSLTLDSNLISGRAFLGLIRASSVNKTLEELRASHQMNCRYLGHQTESEIAAILAETPNLVKLGVSMEFRDSLNKTAVALQKNLDKRRITEDRTLSLKLDRKDGPALLEN